MSPFLPRRRPNGQFDTKPLSEPPVDLDVPAGTKVGLVVEDLVEVPRNLPGTPMPVEHVRSGLRREFPEMGDAQFNERFQEIVTAAAELNKTLRDHAPGTPELDAANSRMYASVQAFAAAAVQ